MEIVVWPARWGAASLDPQCLAALAYIRFAGAPVQVRALAGPLTDGFPPKCPQLRHGNHVVVDIEQIFEYLRKENYGVEYGFEEADLVRMTARIRCVQLRLWPAVQRHWWLESGVYSRCTRPAYAQALRFPLSLLFPVYQHQLVRRRLLAGFGYDLERVAADRLLEQVAKDGEECLSVLAASLGDRRYFIGDSPCSLDALVFGCLFPLLRAPADARLTVALRRHENLVQLCTRVQKEYFPELSAAAASGAESSAGSLEADSRLAVARNAAGFALVAGCVLGAYALHTGWLVVT